MTADTGRSEAVAARLRSDILGGTYRPGDRLPGERDIATRLGVNRSSVREALGRLAHLGLVETRRGGGTTVRPLREASVEVVRHLLGVEGGGPDRDLLAQVLDVHEMLVVGAARLAVERGSEDELLHARELLAQLGAPGAHEAERLEGFDALIDLVTASSGNLVLQLVRNTIRPALEAEGRALEPVLCLAEADPGSLAALDAALSARDPAAAEAAVRALLRARRVRLLAALDASRSDPGSAVDRDADPDSSTPHAVPARHEV